MTRRHRFALLCALSFASAAPLMPAQAGSVRDPLVAETIAAERYASERSHMLAVDFEKLDVNKDHRLSADEFAAIDTVTLPARGSDETLKEPLPLSPF
jgi:hypothetical protein